ncbi:Zn-dependent exopeptidase [Lentinus brumalis]|uniref:Peptide hydrolase n=1 Tax=Lentinus brumalis TaxID=2498619 RepID=A0A371CMG1_9APHY|nr:Zn-dependent exopeptidase [Polyporus brumalis]
MFPRSLQPAHVANGLLFLALLSTSLGDADPLRPSDSQASPASHVNPLFGRECASTDIWPKGPGITLVPQAPTAELRRMLAQIDAKRLDGPRSRHRCGARLARGGDVKHRGGRCARNEHHDHRPELHPAAASRIPTPTNISDVVARIHGASDANRVYVITGHYDSRVTDIMNFTDDAPGADDDGSGVAAVLELLRIMSQRPPPAATIMLRAVAGEEQGLFGVDHLAQILFDAGADVQGMFTNDIVGSSKADDGTIDPFSIRLFAGGIPATGGNASQISTLQSIARLVNDVATNDATGMSVRVLYRPDRFLRGGDHEPFLERGPVTGQQVGDLIEFCDIDFIARVAKSALTNNGTLLWEHESDEGLAGYEVVWRPTIVPFWMNVIPVGMVNKVTVDVSNDNAVLGVGAVGRNGYRSPAALPFPG